MKTISFFSRIALLALALAAAGSTAAFAQTAPAPAASGQSGSAHAPIITPDEKAQLMKDHDAALAANPDLKTEGDNLKKQYLALNGQGDSASQADKDALKAQAKEHEQKVHAAMLAIDPSLAPILAKLDAAHKAAAAK